MTNRIYNKLCINVCPILKVLESRMPKVCKEVKKS